MRWQGVLNVILGCAQASEVLSAPKNQRDRTRLRKEFVGNSIHQAC